MAQDSAQSMTLHRNERMPFMLAGKPYVWVRVNGGPLETRPALRPDGQLTDLALDRIADGV